jgi:hypothetical protein
VFGLGVDAQAIQVPQHQATKRRFHRKCRMRAQASGLALNRHSVALNLGFRSLGAVNALAGTSQNPSRGFVVDLIFAVDVARYHGRARILRGLPFFGPAHPISWR